MRRAARSSARHASPPCASCALERKPCNQTRKPGVTAANEERLQYLPTHHCHRRMPIATTHAPVDLHQRADAHLHESEVSRQKSRAMRNVECSHVRNSFTRGAKLSVSLYTCLRSPTNCRDAPTRMYKTMRKAQLTSCIYVANLMQLRRCEWRYVACAPPPQPFQG